MAPTVVRWAAVPRWVDDDAHELLSEPERERCRALRAPADRRRFVASRLLLRATVAEVTGSTARNVVVRQRCARCGGPHGRPEATVGSRRLEVSMAHAGALVVVAVGDRAVGVDVEPLPAPQEPTPDAGALVSWVRTEAVLKATGHGLDVDPTLVHLGEASAPPRLLAWRGPGRRPRMRIADLDLGPGHVAAVARLGRHRLRVDVREVVLSEGPGAVPTAATRRTVDPAAPPPGPPRPPRPSPRSRTS